MQVITTHLRSFQLSTKQVKSLMKERLPKKMMKLFKLIFDTGESIGMPVCLVGGFVRDLVLGNQNLDVDVVVEGDGIEFAKVLVEKLGGRVRNNAKFCTSVMILEDGFKIDVATARMEFYKHPAALPTVEKSSIRADLFRRDFTINSLAIRLDGKNAYCLIDYFNGQRDLKNKVIRVLHKLSFIEDPSRAFRAIRFEQRFRFSIGKQTLALMKDVVDKKIIDDLSGQRIWKELRLMLDEAKPFNCIRRMRELGLGRHIHPEFLEDEKNIQILEKIQGVLEDSAMVPFQRKPEAWRVYLYSLLFWLKDETLRQTLDRLQLAARLRERIKTDFEGCRAVLELLKKKTEPDPFTLYEVFCSLSPEAILFLTASYGGEQLNKYVLLFYNQYRSASVLSLTGDDLMAMGLPAGPIFQTIFKTLRKARLEGRVKSRDDEMAMVKSEFLNFK